MSDPTGSEKETMNKSVKAWLSRRLTVILIVVTLGLSALMSFVPRIDLYFFEFQSFQLLKLWFGGFSLIVYFVALMQVRDEIRACIKNGEPLELVLAVLASVFFMGLCTLIVFVLLRAIYHNF